MEGRNNSWVSKGAVRSVTRARRARIALRTAPLLTQELFLPAMGRA